MGEEARLNNEDSLFVNDGVDNSSNCDVQCDMDEDDSSCSFQGDTIADKNESKSEEETNDPFEFTLGTIIMNPRQKSKYIDKPARLPTKRLMQYNTGRYVTYDPGNPVVGPSAGPFRRGDRDFGKYDNYKLVDDNIFTLRELTEVRGSSQ